MFGPDKPREFQSGMDQQSLRRHREKDRLSLRRKKREEQLQRKRRQIMDPKKGMTSNSNSNQASALSAYHRNNINTSNSQLASTAGINIQSIVTSSLSTYIKELSSENERERIHGTMCIRILLAKADKQPPYQEIVDSGIVPLLLSFFKHDSNQKLQFEAAWAVTNLCSSTREICNYLCKNNAIKAFEHLLTTTKHFEIMEQAVWGLGNIAGESQELRNIIIKDGIFQFLLERAEQFVKSKNYTLCHNAVWCLSNLVRYDGIGKNKENPDQPPKDLCPWNVLKNMIPIFNKLLNEIGGKIKKLKIQINSGCLQSTDPEYQQCLQCCSDCLWTIHYTQCYMELAPSCSYLYDIFETNLIDIIILFMQMDSVILLSPSLRIIGTFVSGEDDVTLKIINKGYLKAAMLNLNCKVRMIRKEVCWTLSNIAGCEKEIAVKIIQYENGQLLKSLTNTCLFDDDQVKKEAGWVLANIVSLGDSDIIHFMVQKGVIGALRAVMKTSSVKKPLITCMEAFDIIMSHSRSRDGGPYDYITKVEESGCVEIFDILQAGVDDNDKVFTTSYELCSKYWPDDGTPWQPPQFRNDDDDDDANDDDDDNDNDDNDDAKTNDNIRNMMPNTQRRTAIRNNAIQTRGVDITESCRQDPERLARINGDRNGNRNNNNNNNNGQESDQDDDMIQPQMNGNQYQFGLNNNHNNNNNNNNNNNSNGNNDDQPFQF